jgi:predicted ATPase
MKLEFRKDYKSITNFNSIQLEPFTILTGFNGSGKSHLLESLKNGSCQIDNIAISEIVLFDFRTFYLENEQAFNNQQLNQEKLNAWNKLKGQGNPNYQASFAQFKSQLKDENYIKIVEIGKGKPFFSIPHKDFSDENLFNLYSQYKTNVFNFFENQNVKNQQETPALKSLVLNIKETLDVLTEDQFYDLFTPVVLKNDFLPSQIGKLFIDYWYKYQMFLFRQIMKTKSYDEEGLRKRFEKKQGPRPWVLIQEILRGFSSFQYLINNPEHIIIEPARLQSFSLTLKHKISDISVPFDSLSSGEKILFSLVLSIYKSVGDKIFPSLLLLDEIDASLHPSQIQNLLNVINETFVKQNNVKVIIATHSPTTIALADEKNIFIVNSQSENRIEKQSKKEALKILSEGFITLEEGLQILDQVAIKELTIFTEGNNIDFLTKAIELLKPELVSKIEIVSSLKDRTGKEQLSTLYEMFYRMEHKNNVLFIYDCDVTKKLNENEKTNYHIFPKNENNKKVTKGIENLFPEELFEERFYPLKSKEDGGTQSSLDKKLFQTYIFERNNALDFENFKEIIAKIEDIVNKKTNAQQGIAKSGAEVLNPK